MCVCDAEFRIAQPYCRNKCINVFIPIVRTTSESADRKEEEDFGRVRLIALTMNISPALLPSEEG